LVSLDDLAGREAKILTIAGGNDLDAQGLPLMAA